MTSDPSTGRLGEETEKPPNSLRPAMFQTMIWYISTAHFTSQRQNRFESHLDKAERLSIDTKGPIIVWVSQLDKKDLDKILTAQKNNTEGLFPYQEGKVLLLDEGVQQLGLGHNIFNQEPNPFFYKWTEILGKTKLTICRDELRHPCTKRTKLFRHRNTTGELPYIPLAARVDNCSRIRTQQCIQPLEDISGYSDITREARNKYSLHGY